MRNREVAARERLLSLLPRPLSAELFALSGGREAFFESLEELRLRAYGRCSMVLRGVHRVLHTRVDAEALSALAVRLAGGSLYAFEDCIAKGYLPFEGGIRIGICGRAHYGTQGQGGVGAFSSLVIRLPHAHPEDADVLKDAFLHARRGLLIFAAPGVGKTTALRTLALALGTHTPPYRVVVIDERQEFCPEAFSEATVDLLRGYRRTEALEIAYRTLSPEAVLIDEIGGREEAEGLASLLRGGAVAVATAHADRYADLYERGVLRPFFERGIFDVLLSMRREKTRVIYEMMTAAEIEGGKTECFVI